MAKTLNDYCFYCSHTIFVSFYIRVFSSCQDEAMSFDDYLDMYSALSEQATRDVKTAYAFRIYDFDGDGVIGS